MGKLKISTSEPLTKTVRKRLLNLNLILLRQIPSHYLNRMRNIVIQPRLRRLKMHNHLPKVMQHILDILLVQFLLQALLFIYLKL